MNFIRRTIVISTQSSMQKLAGCGLKEGLVNTKSGLFTNAYISTVSNQAVFGHIPTLFV